MSEIKTGYISPSVPSKTITSTMFRCVLVLALATCAFAGYLGYGGYSVAAPALASYSSVHHAPVVSTVGYGHGLGYGYGHGLGYGYGHGLGYGYGHGYGHRLGYGYGLSGYGLGHGYGLGRLGYGGFYKKFVTDAAYLRFQCMFP